MSCDSGMQNEAIQPAQADYIGTVAYFARSIPLQETERIHGLWVDGERIFYYYIIFGASNNQQLIVKSILADGPDKQSIEIPVSASGEIVGVHTADEGQIGVLTVVSDNIHYARYYSNGTESFSHTFYDINLDDVISGQIKNAHFSGCGRIILTVNNFHNSSLHILNVASGESYEIQFFEEVIGINSQYDERIVAGFISQNGVVFREINTSSGQVENTYNTTFSHIVGMLQAEPNSPFDLLLTNELYLFGYCLETGESSLWNHMSADLSAFFAGSRSAEDTARIMQSRVQIYLSEQS